jgi:hypothetical protein
LIIDSNNDIRKRAKKVFHFLFGRIVFFHTFAVPALLPIENITIFEVASFDNAKYNFRLIAILMIGN